MAGGAPAAGRSQPPSGRRRGWAAASEAGPHWTVSSPLSTVVRLRRAGHGRCVRPCAWQVWRPGGWFRRLRGSLESMAKRATERLIANRYIRERILGRGGMGVVWRARDQLLGRDVAIKEVQLPPSLTAGDLDAMRARVLREARAAAHIGRAHARNSV